MGRFLVLLLLAGCGFENTVDRGGDGAAQAGQWTKKRKLTIDNTSIGPLSSFALALHLNSSRITYGSTLANGADVRVGDASGAFYPYEIEQWDPAGISIVWVRVPTIAANAKTDLYLYYGNPMATDAQNAAGVWDEEYVGVWHLADGHDSTGRLTSTNNGGAVVPGRLGKALRFTGNDTHVDTGSTEHLMRFTIELWLSPTNPAQNNGPQAPVSKFPNYAVLWSCATMTFCKTVLFNSSNPLQTHFASYDAPVTPSWTYLVGRYNGTSVRAYINGIQSNDGPSTATPTPSTPTAKIGSHAGLDGDFLGDIDEVRISRTGRSDDYIRAHSRSTSDSYVTYGDEEPVN